MLTQQKLIVHTLLYIFYIYFNFSFYYLIKFSLYYIFIIFSNWYPICLLCFPTISQYQAISTHNCLWQIPCKLCCLRDTKSAYI